MQNLVNHDIFVPYVYVYIGCTCVTFSLSQLVIADSIESISGCQFETLCAVKAAGSLAMLWQQLTHQPEATVYPLSQG